MNNLEKIIAALDANGCKDLSQVVALTVGEQKANIAGEIGALSIIVDEAEDSAKKGDFDKASESLDYLSESAKDLAEKIDNDAVTSEASNKNPILFKFKDPYNDKEKLCRFKLIEDRGDRVLVEESTFTKNFNIKPTSVYKKSDLIEAAVTSEFKGDLDSIIKEIKEYTNDNNVSDAYIVMCKKILKNNILAKAFEGLKHIESYKGHLTSGVRAVRNELIEDAEKHAKQILSDDEFKRVHRAF